jgi:hypothetical protein|tara:strand:+ start:1668 stop:1937 length:270 start_codon:yes stop_codon:yes gene_type:complete
MIKPSRMPDETLSENYNSVSKPFHYNTGDIECIDYIKQVLGNEGFIAYCQGNMIKYQHRHRYKQKPVEDMEKAAWYMDKMMQTMKEVHK